MARKPVATPVRRIIVGVGRGRIGKTRTMAAIGEMIALGGRAVTAWDIDRAPSLQRRLSDARRPNGKTDSARRLLFEDCIQATVGGQADAVVDVGADDMLLHQMNDMLPEMLDLLAEQNVEIVGLHVLGHDPHKDLAYFDATTAESGNVFHRHIVALNYGMAPDGDPDKAFAQVRKLVAAKHLPVHVIRRLPPDVLDALWPDDLKDMLSLEALMGPASKLGFFKRMVLQSWLKAETDSIARIIDEIYGIEPTMDMAAE